MTELTSRFLDDPATCCQTISQYIYQTLVTIQQQQPQWLQEKYRQKPWHLPNYQTAFVEKMTQGLTPVASPSELLRKVEQYLHLFFTPEFMESSESQGLLRKIQHSLSPAPSSLTRHFSRREGIAILLLDAENLQLDPNTEKFLESICQYPLQIKVAFGNWRSLGKQDVHYHQRGYQLIHVPAGKDSADLKLATVGASIFVHYPTAKEIFICSSDQALTHLRNTLQSHGLNVYQVQKHQEQITVLNFQTGHLHHYSLVANPEVPSLDVLIEQLKEIIGREQTENNTQWVKLSRISSLYKKQYNLALNQIVSLYFPGSHLKDLFFKNTAEFAIHRVSDNSQIYITLFTDKLPEVPDQKTGEVLENQPLILSTKDLELYLVKLLTKLTQNQPQKFIQLSHLASEFNLQYGQPVTQVIKQLQVKQKFPQFLDGCPEFNVKKVKAIWMVSLKLANA